MDALAGSAILFGLAVGICWLVSRSIDRFSDQVRQLREVIDRIPDDAAEAGADALDQSK